MGAAKVMSGDYMSTYGFEYNPPYEFHAWVVDNGNIIDLALPGVIEKGLITKDDVGYYLVKRKPVILAGTEPNWISYKQFELIK